MAYNSCRDRDSVPDSDRDPEAKTAAELDVDPVVELVSYLAFSPVDPVFNQSHSEIHTHSNLLVIQVLTF